nr:TIGR03032 family protein [Hephaestia sp. MAHUQ-44]
MTNEAQPDPAVPPAESANASKISVSRGLGAWLKSHATSLAFTSYQTGQLFLVGVQPNGTVSFNQQNFTRAMGVYYRPGRLYLGTHFQLWRLENILQPGQVGNQHFDQVFVPRNAQVTGDIDIHELGVTTKGQVVFVNTRYSCLATPDSTHSFRPIWKPPFISKLAGEDRCHLNGLAMDKGEPAYVTAVSKSDALSGWRDRRHEGGMLIDVRTNQIVTDKLSMPHSPRVHGKKVYALDSGRGQIVEISAQGEIRDIAFCPGFLRGLAIHDGHAIVTVSMPRNGAFNGLKLDDELTQRATTPWCGVLIVNMTSGDIVEWIRLEGQITELFDVTAMPGVKCPMAVGPSTPEIASTITYSQLD